MSDEREELAAARARIAQLEREAEANRVFVENAVAQARKALPARSTGPTFWHFAAMGLGLVVGVLITLAGVVLRDPDPALLQSQRPQRVEKVREAVPIAVPIPVLMAVPAAADAGKPVAARAPPPAAKPAAAMRTDDSGALNLTATSPAMVFVDGKRLGPAPLYGVVFRPGEHFVRFVCASDAGQPAEKRVLVPPYAEVDVEHHCE